MLRSAYGLLRASGRVLLEAAPEGVDVDEIGRALAGHPEVNEVHDLHVWEVTSGFPALSAHVLVDPECDCHAVRRALEAMLAERFGITHTTLQVDHTRALAAAADRLGGVSDRTAAPPGGRRRARAGRGRPRPAGAGRPRRPRSAGARAGRGARR